MARRTERGWFAILAKSLKSSLPDWRSQMTRPVVIENLTKLIKIVFSMMR